jgi:penicillin-binding protein 1A
MTGKRIVAGFAALGLAAGGTAWAYEQISDNKVTEAALSTEGYDLPPMVTTQTDALICPESVKQCTAESALGVMAVSHATEVPLEKVSGWITEALIAAEDRKFAEHKGVNDRSVVRAGIHNARGGPRQGGSTIDRQVAGLLFPTPPLDALKHDPNLAIRGLAYANPAYAREAYQARAALAMNEKFSKEQILELYLNNAFFGRGAYGIENAAQAYFGKHAKDITLMEATVLVALLPAPGRMDISALGDDDPRLNGQKELLLRHVDRVVDALDKHAPNVTDADIAKLRTEDIRIRPYKPRPHISNDFSAAEAIGARHFIEDARLEAASILNLRDLEGRLDPNRLRGYNVYVTLKPKNQRALFNALNRDGRLRAPNVDAAGISLSQDGAVTAEVGGKDFEASQVNLATGRGGSGRDSGSGNKPYAWAAAYTEGWEPDMMFKNIPNRLTIPDANNGQDWVIDTSKDCDHIGREPGCDMTLKEGLAASSNFIAGKIVQEFGVDAIVGYMRRFGMSIPDKDVNPSLVLGTGRLTPADEAVGAAGLVANRGESLGVRTFGSGEGALRSRTYTVSKITDPSGRVLYQADPHPQTDRKRVVDVEVAKAVTEAMQGVVRRGTAAGTMDLPAGRDSVAAKTGTGNGNTDLWTNGVACNAGGKGEAGYQSVSMWVGDPRRKRPIGNFTSADVARMVGRYFSAVQGSKNCDVAD